MSIRELKSFVMEDLRNHGGHGFRRIIITSLFNMSFRLILNYRIGNFLAKRRNFINNLIILFLKRKQIVKRNCDISYHAEIGRRVKFPHPLSIVVGDKVIIGNDVIIWHEVTLGSDGQLEKEKSYPKIQSKTRLYVGSKVIGNIEIGENSVVGANSVVISNVPRNTTVVGAPARKVRKK